MVFDSESTIEIVTENLQKGKNIKPAYIQNWLTALFSAISENDIAAEEEYLFLLRIATNANEQNREQVSKQIPKLFDISCENQSFINSYKRIIRLNDASKAIFDERTIIFNHLKSYKYATPRSINDINLSGTIESIVLCDFLTNDEKVNIGYWLFDSVLNNINIDENEKLAIVYDGFCSLLWLDDDYGFGDVRVNTTILIFKKEVLISTDFEFGKDVFKVIIKAIYNRNQFT